MIIEKLCSGGLTFGKPAQPAENKAPAAVPTPAANAQETGVAGLIGAGLLTNAKKETKPVEDPLKDIKKTGQEEKFMKAAAQEKEVEPAQIGGTSSAKHSGVGHESLPGTTKDLKEAPKMMEAKKEAEDVHHYGAPFGDKPKTPVDDKFKKDDLLAGSKKVAAAPAPAQAEQPSIPKDAMKKKQDPVSKLGHQHLNDDFDDDGLDDPELAYPHENENEEHVGGPYDEANDPNQLVASDDVYMSESYGYNFSVNSEAMEQFDYVEDVEPVDK